MDAVLGAIRSLLDLPHRGRPGRIEGTRELVVGATDHVIAYLVREAEIVVIRVRHGRQDWPA